MDESTSGTSGIDRRTLLSSLASASGIGVGFTSVTGDGAAEPETTIRELTGEERKRTLREALKDDGTDEALSSHLPADAEMTDSKVVRSSYEETDWRVVSARFESESGTEASVFWSDHDETEPAVTVVEPTSDAENLQAVETPTAGVVPIGVNPCGDWEEMPDPDCVVETAYLYAEEIVACGRCAATIRDEIDTGKLSKKKLLFALARSAPSCGMCLYKMIDEYSEHGVPCELCVPKDEVGLDGEDTVMA